MGYCNYIRMVPKYDFSFIIISILIDINLLIIDIKEKNIIQEHQTSMVIILREHGMALFVYGEKSYINGIQSPTNQIQMNKNIKILKI